MRVSFSAEALVEFEAATDRYLTEFAFAAADDFEIEIGHALALLDSFPEIGTANRYKTRALTLPKFPYSLIYRINPGEVRIIAIANHSRKPGYWRGRE
jgi:toxin ParE1/3/4